MQTAQLIDWNERQDELSAGQEFVSRDGCKVMLYRPVSGDRGSWIVADWVGGNWSFLDGRVGVADLVERLAA